MYPDFHYCANSCSNCYGFGKQERLSWAKGLRIDMDQVVYPVCKRTLREDKWRKTDKLSFAFFQISPFGFKRAIFKGKSLFFAKKGLIEAFLRHFL